MQTVLIWHIFLPNLLITALWAGRVMIESTVNANANIDKLLETNSTLQLAWALHTTLMVTSNVYSAYVLSFLFPNSCSFKLVKDECAGYTA